jgi:hypothetical protein
MRYSGVRAVVVAGLALWPALAGAETLTGPQITAALTERVVIYDDGAQQVFQADGATVFDNGRPSSGRWAVRGDQYCSQWPPSETWACYGVEIEGDLVRFVAADGSASAGKLQPGE